MKQKNLSYWICKDAMFYYGSQRVSGKTKKLED